MGVFIERPRYGINQRTKMQHLPPIVRPILIVAVSLLSFGPAQATDYFVSPDGSDLNTGTSQSAPWETMNRVNRVHLQAGDRVLLKGGMTFIGSLALNEEDRGSLLSPIVITSYGGGRALVVTEDGAGLRAHNTAGIAISDIDFTAAAGSNRTTTGIEFYNDSEFNVLLEGIWIKNADISGFGTNGISIGAWNGPNGFRHIRIENIRVHHNGMNGFVTYGEEPSFAIQDIHLIRVVAHDNKGSLNAKPNSGSGIVLGSVLEGTVEMSTSYNNGADGNAGIGIWAYASSHIVMRFNESYANHTAGDSDGSGFAFDGGVADSIMEFNYSHDNDGSGFAMNQYEGAPIWARNIVRNNISIVDGRRNSYGAIQIWSADSALKDALFEDNIVVVGRSADGISSALVFRGGTENFKFQNNAFFSLRDSMLIPALPNQDGTLFLENRCWAGAFALEYSAPGMCDTLMFLDSRE